MGYLEKIDEAVKVLLISLQAVQECRNLMLVVEICSACCMAAFCPETIITKQLVSVGVDQALAAVLMRVVSQAEQKAYSNDAACLEDEHFAILYALEALGRVTSSCLSWFMMKNYRFPDVQSASLKALVRLLRSGVKPQSPQVIESLAKVCRDAIDSSGKSDTELIHCAELALGSFQSDYDINVDRFQRIVGILAALHTCLEVCC